MSNLQNQSFHHIYDALLESLKREAPQNDQYDDTHPIVRRRNPNTKHNVYNALLETIKNEESQNDQYDDTHPIVRRRNPSTVSLQRSNSFKDHNQFQTVKRHRGLSSLHQSRMELAYPKKVPLLNIKSVACVEQIIIVFCITTLITLRNSTEHFFYNTRETLHDTFNSKDSLLRTQHLVNDIEKQFNTYFNLTTTHVDYILYPQEILTEYNIPSATLEFVLNSTNSETKRLFTLNPYNYSILGNNDSISNELILSLKSSNYISLHFEIELYSFNDEVRNLWRWYLHYSYHIDATSHRIIPQLIINWLRLSTDVYWWNKKSIGYICFIIAALGLVIFSVVAIIHFIYQYKISVIFSFKGIKKLKYRMLLPISHIICLICGIMYILNLCQIYDLNDEWWFRGILAITVLIAWCMLSVALNITSKETQYAALFKTIEISLKPSIILLISILPLTMGYTLFGTLLFGIPYDGPNDSQMFTSSEITAKTLYSVLLGDDVYDSFLTLGIGDNRNIVGEIYMYSWSILFIAVIFNIFLAIIEDNFFKTMPSFQGSNHKLSDTEQENENNENKQMFDEWELYTIENNYIPVTLPTNRIEIELQKTLPKNEKINRNNKYINSFVTHMDNEIMMEIKTHLTENVMDKLLQKYTIKNLDKLRDDIVTYYESYLNKITVHTQKYIAKFVECETM